MNKVNNFSEWSKNIFKIKQRRSKKRKEEITRQYKKLEEKRKGKKRIKEKNR